MKVTITQNANVVEATIEGRLDTVTSAEFEKQLAPFYQTPGIELILDCTAME